MWGWDGHSKDHSWDYTIQTEVELILTVTSIKFLQTLNERIMNHCSLGGNKRLGETLVVIIFSSIDQYITSFYKCFYLIKQGNTFLYCSFIKITSNNTITQNELM